MAFIVLAACSPSAAPPVVVENGFSRADVIGLRGEPDRKRDFVLPQAPFFGPQESLVNLVPAGSTIEEWVYQSGERVSYVWFADGDAESRGDWRVIATAEHPGDAVF